MTGLVLRCSADELLSLLPDGVAALVYADPPHCTGRLFRGTSGWHHKAVEVFSDRWTPLEDGGSANLPDGVRDVVDAVSSLYPDTGLGRYLAFIGACLVGARRVLDERGSLFLHVGLDAYHGVRLVSDAVFGRRCVNVIVWHRTGGGRPRRRFPHKYDLILWYSRTKSYRFFPDNIRVPYCPTSGYAKAGIVARSGKRYMPNPKGTIPDDVWRIPMVNPMSRERAGYPTQKPAALLARIVSAVTGRGDLVVDPFCGSGTTGVVAGRLGRRFLMCDVSEYAVEVAAARLDEAGVPFRLLTEKFENELLRFLEETCHRRSEGEGAFLQQKGMPGVQGREGVA